MGKGCTQIRGTPVGKQPISLPVVGFTISVESATASGPQDGFVLVLLFPPRRHERNGFFMGDKEYPAYSRALGGIFGSHMPEKSGSPHAVFGTCPAGLRSA